MENIGIVWSNPAMPIFWFLGQFDCTDEVPMNEEDLFWAMCLDKMASYWYNIVAIKPIAQKGVPLWERN